VFAWNMKITSYAASSW